MLEAFKHAADDYKAAKSAWQARRVDFAQRKEAYLASAPVKTEYFTNGLFGRYIPVDAKKVSLMDMLGSHPSVHVLSYKELSLQFVKEQIALERSKPTILNTYLPALFVRGGEEMGQEIVPDQPLDSDAPVTLVLKAAGGLSRRFRK